MMPSPPARKPDGSSKWDGFMCATIYIDIEPSREPKPEKKKVPMVDKKSRLGVKLFGRSGYGR